MMEQPVCFLLNLFPNAFHFVDKAEPEGSRILRMRDSGGTSVFRH
jgi:hypothetical protein